jgi:hypothetical protein
MKHIPGSMRYIVISLLAATWLGGCAIVPAGDGHYQDRGYDRGYDHDYRDYHGDRYDYDNQAYHGDRVEHGE